jgi:hypothetical protein
MVPANSNSDSEKILWVQQLAEGFLDRHLPIVDKLEELLNEDPVRASRALHRIIKTSLRRFEKTCRYKQESQVQFNSDGSYTFQYTYPSYYLGETDFLELVPTTIAAVGNKSYSYTSVYWTYRNPNMYMTSGNQIIRAFCDWPFYEVIAPDGSFTEDCHIYGMTKQEQDFYIDFFDFEMLKVLKQRLHLVQLPFQIDFLQVDLDLQDLQEKVELHEASIADVTFTWI